MVINSDMIRNVRNVANVAERITNATNAFTLGLDAIDAMDKGSDHHAEWISMVRIGLEAMKDKARLEAMKDKARLEAMKDKASKSYRFHDDASLSAWIDANLKRMCDKRSNAKALTVGGLVEASQVLAYRNALAIAVDRLTVAAKAVKECKARVALVITMQPETV